MPYRRKGSFGIRPVINSIKNVFNSQIGITGTATSTVLAKAVNTPLPTVTSDTSQGCVIKAIYIQLDVCGTGAAGVLNVGDIYLIKNPGNNLTNPAPISQGSSNEKKFIFKTWRFMIMRVQDGGQVFHWEGWVKIPKRYWRMGTDDTITMVSQATASQTGHLSVQAIYKWYR